MRYYVKGTDIEVAGTVDGGKYSLVLTPDQVEARPTFQESDFPVGTVLILRSNRVFHIHRERDWLTVYVDGDTIQRRFQDVVSANSYASSSKENFERDYKVIKP